MLVKPCRHHIYPCTPSPASRSSVFVFLLWWVRARPWTAGVYRCTEMARRDKNWVLWASLLRRFRFHSSFQPGFPVFLLDCSPDTNDYGRLPLYLLRAQVSPCTSQLMNICFYHVYTLCEVSGKSGQAVGMFHRSCLPVSFLIVGC